MWSKIKAYCTVGKDNAGRALSYLSVPKTRMSQVGCAATATAAAVAVVTGMSTAPVMVPAAIVSHALWCGLENKLPEWDTGALEAHNLLSDLSKDELDAVSALLRPGGAKPVRKDRSVCDTCEMTEENVCDTCEVSK